MGKMWNFILERFEYLNNIDNNAHLDMEIYNSFQKQHIIEGLIKTHPSNDSLKIILNRFPELNGNIEEDGEIYLEGHFAALKKYAALFSNLGYFISTITKNGSDWLKDFKNIDVPIAIFLEAKYDQKIKVDQKFIYHATLLRNWISIQKYGMIPKSLSKKAKHPERIYLSTDRNIAHKFEKFLEIEKGEPTILLKIDISNLPIQFYRDVNWRESGVYILDNIPSKYITRI